MGGYFKENISKEPSFVISSAPYSERFVVKKLMNRFLWLWPQVRRTRKGSSMRGPPQLSFSALDIPLDMLQFRRSYTVDATLETMKLIEAAD